MAGGVNDTVILIGIIVFFVALGWALPLIRAELSSADATQTSDIENNIEVGNEIGILKIVSSIALMFLWTFGAIPPWLDALVFVPLRITFGVILYRLIRHGGG